MKRKPPAPGKPTLNGSSAAADRPLRGQEAEPAVSEQPLTPASARSQLRRAKRARKLYERDEVRRFTARSRRRRNLTLSAAGILAALIAFVVVGVYSPVMAFREIEVVGTNRIPAVDIQNALAGQLGTPLPLLDFAQVKSELAQFSLIQSFVTESRPPGTLVVRIIEREPVGLLTSAAGFDLIDRAGVVISSGPQRPAGYPVIVTQQGVGSAGFESALAVMTALPEGLRAQLDTITAATTDDVTLTLTGGARVVWGSAEESEFKALVLAALIVTNPVGTVGEYDVTSPKSAVLR